jgi:hypothetical protein
MKNLQSTQLSSPASTRVNLPTIRDLSTEQQSEWIERIFLRLATIYGTEFTKKWGEVDPDTLKAEWARALGGFEAQDIAAALTECRAQPKAPNLPEFSAMCRRHMVNRVKVDLPPLSQEEKAAAAMVAEKVAEGMRANSEAKAGEYWLNGVLVTKYRTWAVNLLKREAAGEFIHLISAEDWRAVLGYQKDTNANAAFNDLQSVLGTM